MGIGEVEDQFIQTRVEAVVSPTTIYFIHLRIVMHLL